MDDNLTGLLFNSAIIFIFLAALLIYFHTNRTNNKVINTLSYSYNNDKIINMGLPVEEYKIKGSEIVANIRDGLDSDISIDNITIPYDSTWTNNDLLNNYTEIQDISNNIINVLEVIDVDGEYKVRNIINTKGNLIRIEYEIVN